MRFRDPSQGVTKITLVMCLPCLPNSVFADVGNPPVVEVDQVGSSCTVLSVGNIM